MEETQNNGREEREALKQKKLLLSGVLEEIYTYRLLNRSLLKEEFFKKKGIGEADADSLLDLMVDQGFLEEESEETAGTVLFLTEQATARLKREGRVLQPIPAEGLRLDPYLFRHQLSLNSFVYALKKVLDGNFSYRYYDLKHLPAASPNLWPDGIVELNECFLFLEMDMGTERSRELCFKWENYRDFFKEHPSYYDKPVFMLFILSGSSYCSARRHTVLKTAFPFVGENLSEGLEVYAEGPEALLSCIRSRLDFCLKGENSGEEELLKSQPDFLEIQKKSWEEHVTKAGKGRGDYRIKARVKDGEKEKEVLLTLDFWLDNRLSVAKTIDAYSEAAAEDPEGTLPLYLIIVEDRNQAKRELNRVDCRIGVDIYFLMKKDMTLPDWKDRLFQLKGPVGSRWIYGCGDFFQRVSAPL